MKLKDMPLEVQLIAARRVDEIIKHGAIAIGPMPDNCTSINDAARAIGSVFESLYEDYNTPSRLILIKEEPLDHE